MLCSAVTLVTQNILVGLQTFVFVQRHQRDQLVASESIKLYWRQIRTMCICMICQIVSKISGDSL
jgi:uncharacterized membrane protein